MTAARPVAHGVARSIRPARIVLAARWALVIGWLALGVTVALILVGVIGPRHAAPAPYRPLGVCVVVAHAVNGGGVLCADGTVRP